jgi:Zn-dependent protease with chaperone function
MADPLTVIGEALFTYWTSPWPLTVLLVCGASMGTLLYVFVSNARNAKLRVSLLTGLYALSIFFWLFIALSLVLCVWQSGMVAYRRNGVQTAVAGAVLSALVATLVVSAVVWRQAPARALRTFAPRAPHPDEAWIQEYADLLAKFEAAPRPEVGVVESLDILAIAINARPPRILVSEGLLATLDPDEIRSAVAHEVMHLKHHDAEFKVFSTVLSRILFFDPFSKFFDPAVHREREYLADEMSGRATGKPSALASALVKIASRPAPQRAAWGLSIVGPGTGIFSRYPPLRERVTRLLLLSDLLAASRASVEKP